MSAPLPTIRHPIALINKCYSYPNPLPLCPYHRTKVSNACSPSAIWFDCSRRTSVSPAAGPGLSLGTLDTWKASKGHDEACSLLRFVETGRVSAIAIVTVDLISLLQTPNAKAWRSASSSRSISASRIAKS